MGPTNVCKYPLKFSSSYKIFKTHMYHKFSLPLDPSPHELLHPSPRPRAVNKLFKMAIQRRDGRTTWVRWQTLAAVLHIVK